MIKQETIEIKIKPVIELFSSGEIKKALLEIENLINDYPNQPLLLNICGVIYQEDKRSDKAIKRFKEALNINPNYAEAHNNLGVTLQAMGQLEEAVKSHKESISIKPNYTEAHNNLGVTLQDLGQNEAAIESYENALVSNPDYVDAHNNLGNIYKKIGRLSKAVESYNKVILMNPDFAEAHFNLGGILNSQGKFDAAVESFNNTIKIRPNAWSVYLSLGNTLREQGKLDKAAISYKKIIEIKPDFSEAHYKLGGVLKQLGHIDDAKKHYEEALEINPDYAAAHYSLSNLIKYKDSDPRINKMHSLLEQDNLNTSERINLSFALAKVYENQENQDQMFKFLHEGNRLRKNELDYSLDKQKKLFSVIKEIYRNPANIKKNLPLGPSNIRPIFIVGMPRSGSTLVEQILSSHNAVYGIGESQSFRKLLAPIIKKNLKQGSKIASTSIGDSKINIGNTYDLQESTFLSIREKYLDDIANLNLNESIIIDKSLLNFRFIGFILSAFPEAKIIHTQRDARAICWSIYKNLFNAVGYGNNYDDLVGFYSLYSELMDFWHKLFPDRIYDISYEDLTNNQERETKLLLEHCDLDWDENCLNFHKTKRVVKTSSLLQVREKMYQGSSDAWKKHKAHIEPLIKALGSY